MIECYSVKCEEPALKMGIHEFAQFKCELV